MDRHDVEKRGEVGPDPSTSVILVRDGIHSQLAHEGCDFLLGPLILDLVQCLGQDVGSAPSEDPERLLAGIHAGDQRRRRVAGSWLVQCGEAIHRVAGDELRGDLVCGRVGSGLGDVAVEVVYDLSVAVEDTVDGWRVDGVVLPRRRHGSDVDDVELVRVGQEPHQTHLVVWLVGDVRHDEHPGLVLVLVRLAQVVALTGPDVAGERREGKAGQGEKPPKGDSSTTHCCYGRLVNMGNRHESAREDRPSTAERKEEPFIFARPRPRPSPHESIAITRAK